MKHSLRFRNIHGKRRPKCIYFGCTHVPNRTETGPEAFTSNRGDLGFASSLRSRAAVVEAEVDL